MQPNTQKLLCGLLKCKTDASEEEMEAKATAIMTAHEARLPKAIDKFHKTAAEESDPAEAAAAKAVADHAEICKALGVEPDKADAPFMCGQIVNLKTQIETAPKAEEFNAMKAELSTLKASALMAKAESEGKIIPTNKEFAENLAKKDPAMFDAWLASAPKVDPSKTEIVKPGDKKNHANVPIDRDRLLVACGGDKEKYREALKQMGEEPEAK